MLFGCVYWCPHVEVWFASGSVGPLLHYHHVIVCVGFYLFFGHPRMASKVQDGLFLGDASVASDAEFLEANKVSRIVNCAPNEVRNCNDDVQYFSIDWKESSSVRLDWDLIQRVTAFIALSHDEGESVLIHSKTGRCRAPVLAVVWLMVKYNWAVVKALEFVRAKTVVEIPRPVMDEVIRFGKHFASLSSDWVVAPSNPDELLLFNTYINSVPKSVPQSRAVFVSSRGRRKRVDWASRLEQPPSRRNLGTYTLKSSLKVKSQTSDSNASTAASSPQTTPVVPGPLIRSLSRQPSPVTSINGHPAATPSTLLTSALRTIRQSPSIASLGAFKPTASRVIPPPATFSRHTVKASPHHARAPSPMVRHSSVPQAPVLRAGSVNARAPSPARPERRTPFTPSIRINEGQVLPVIAAYRRSPSPMLSRPGQTRPRPGAIT